MGLCILLLPYNYTIVLAYFYYDWHKEIFPAFDIKESNLVKLNQRVFYRSSFITKPINYRTNTKPFVFLV